MTKYRPFTHEELKRLISDNYDAEQIVEMLGVTPVQLVTRFEDVIEERFDKLLVILDDDLFFEEYEDENGFEEEQELSWVLEQ